MPTDEDRAKARDYYQRRREHILGLGKKYRIARGVQVGKLVSRDGLSNTPLYVIWKLMIRRCTRPTDRRWKDYGGSGVKVCERWMDFRNFIADVAPRPEGKSLDRYPDKHGDYEPG